MSTPRTLVVALVALSTVAACRASREGAPKAAAPQGKVLATVNGVPITAEDLEERTRRAVTGGGPAHDAPEVVLQTLVRDELLHQKAVALGLDADEAYRKKIALLEAQIRGVERQELKTRLRAHVQQQAAVSDDEARAWFDENLPLVQSRLHVLQLLVKGDDAALQRDRAELASGTPFATVAARRFPGLPVTGRPPWDLGELHWSQLPAPWLGIVDRLQPGQVSEVIKGEGGRGWIVQLAGRRVDPGVTFEGERERIVEALRRRKADALYDAMLAEATAKAEIVYPK